MGTAIWTNVGMECLEIVLRLAVAERQKYIGRVRAAVYDLEKDKDFLDSFESSFTPRNPFFGCAVSTGSCYDPNSRKITFSNSSFHEARRKKMMSLNGRIHSFTNMEYIYYPK